MSPANIPDPVKVEAQRKAQRVVAAREGRHRDRSRVAEQFARNLDPAARARVRAQLLRYRQLFGTGPDGPEQQVINLIDQASKDEAG